MDEKVQSSATAAPSKTITWSRPGECTTTYFGSLAAVLVAVSTVHHVAVKSRAIEGIIRRRFHGSGGLCSLGGHGRRRRGTTEGEGGKKVSHVASKN